MKKTVVTLFFILIAYSPVHAGTSLIGEEGFINTPSAKVMSERQISLGLSYLPSSRSYINIGNTNLIYSFFIGFLPRTEVGFLYNQVFGWIGADNPYLKTSQFDRSVYLKLQILEENEYFPAIAIGGRDIFSSSLLDNRKARSSSHQQIFYIATSKSFSDYKVNLGYSYAPGIPLGFIANKKGEIFDSFRVNGLFLAFETPKFFDTVSGIVEYDSTYLNYGIDIVLFNEFNIKIAAVDLYHFNFRFTWSKNM